MYKSYHVLDMDKSGLKDLKTANSNEQAKSGNLKYKNENNTNKKQGSH